METIYVDSLQFLYHLALAILVGGGLVLGAAVAPAIFATMRSRGEAGALFGAALARWDGLAILCVVVVVITSGLKAGAFELSGAPEGRLVARWVALLVLCASVIYSSGWANPVARSLRAQTPSWDDLPETTPLRQEFAKMHASSSRAMRLAVLSGL
ncbi:MAG: DUF4149 domain-containing protein, partial [Chloroflexota bacterium]